MPPKTKFAVANVVNLDSDSDEDERVTGRGAIRSKASQMENREISNTIGDTTVTPHETLECRSFWKAGENFVVPQNVTPAATGMVEHARVHPKFLHSNATSHKWAFGAIAEIVDNAVDEIQNGATFVKIDKVDLAKDNSPALVFLDDGGGMDPNGIRKCMSLGYSSKKSNTTIGQYGNGFKTSTMRLGADAIVFSRSTRSGKFTQSIGLLSYTFLRKTGQDDVIVPMIDMDISDYRPQPITYGSPEDWSTNLNILLKWSPFSTEHELLQQFEDIGGHGTKVIVYNLWLNDERIYELCFDDDDEDIRLRDVNAEDGKQLDPRRLELRSHISYGYRHSLRAYTSILYLKKFKDFKIIIRGVTVEQFNIADGFQYPETIMYKPHAATMGYAATEIKVGFVKEAPKLAVCGFNVYHKNRLIQPFWNVTSKGSTLGNGVVGVLEANFIEPAHDKQDFERSSLFLRLESKLKKTVMEYWNTHCHIFGYKYYKSPSDKSKRIAIPDPPPTVNPLPLPSDKISQGGPIIREISHSNATSIRSVAAAPPLPSDKISQGGPIIREISHRNATSIPTVAAVPPHLRKSTGLGYNIQPVLLTPRPAATTTVSEFQPVLLTPRPAATTTAPENYLDDKSADEISLENIQLFMKCEEFIKKENEMEQTVKKLEKELEDFKSKCAQLALIVDAKRKEMQQV